MSELTDSQRLDVLDLLVLDNRDMLEIHQGRMFTVITQHQPQANIRAAIDTIHEFMIGMRCWKCENGHGCARHGKPYANAKEVRRE